MMLMLFLSNIVLIFLPNLYLLASSSDSNQDNEYNYIAIGPYKDEPDRALRYGPGTGGSQNYTNDTCYLTCYKTYNYIYFAVQYGHQCWCDNNLTHATKYGEGNCGPDGDYYCNFIYQAVTNSPTIQPTIQPTNNPIVSSIITTNTLTSTIDNNDGMKNTPTNTETYVNTANSTYDSGDGGSKSEGGLVEIGASVLVILIIIGVLGLLYCIVYCRMARKIFKSSRNIDVVTLQDEEDADKSTLLSEIHINSFDEDSEIANTNTNEIIIKDENGNTAAELEESSSSSEESTDSETDNGI